MIKLIVLIYLILNFTTLACAELVPAKNAKLKKIEWSTSNEVRLRFKSYFDEFTDKPWDILKFKIKLDQVGKELFNNGYFTSNIKMELLGTDTDVVAKIIISANDRINFQFTGNTIFSHQELRKKLIEKIKNDFGKTDKVMLGNYINEIYENAGFYNTITRSTQNEGKDLDKVLVRNYFFDIDEGDKITVPSIQFHGNSAISENELYELFKKNASTLALAGYYDKIFFENFTEIIKKEYLSKGFVFVEVSKPRISSEDEEAFNIEFGIVEKQQVILKSIDLSKLELDLQTNVKNILVNKENSPLNVVELEADLRRIVSYFQNNGYYFANIKNLNDESLLKYDKAFTFVDLAPEVELDRKVCFNEAIVNGNSKTLPEVIFREINLVKGELITPEKIENLRQKLSGLGLFSTLRLTPYMVADGDDKSCAVTNLVIQVKEKDFGLLEVAPGYRTDLGAKLSTGVTYNNFMGMNRSASFKVQANQRFNLDGFDDKRKAENKKLLEYLARVSYVEPYLINNIIHTQIELEWSSSFQRKRFYGFDADIFRISPQLSKNITKNFSTSLKYQFERINQFDATALKDNDNFTIGGVTPSVTYDKRNDSINPRSGYYLNLSSEWANNYFGSMKNDDLEVNYVKVISRNKFYYPLGEFTLAFSLALGYERNFAQDVLKDGTGAIVLNSNNIPRTHGYIPSIKVFRLDGYDEIRGYDESEINRLKSGTPIGDVVVQNEAYFTAFKFEPRYNLTDTIQMGVFFDAGRVSVSSFLPFDLRTSVGTGLKFLTPVGSLDFDYGVKLQRETYSDKKRDATGRFHLSIGFF